MSQYDAGAGMPNVYDNNVPQQNEGIINRAYLKTVPGIVRVCEMVRRFYGLVLAAPANMSGVTAAGGEGHR